MNPDNCSTCTSLLPEYLDGKLHAETVLFLEAHLLQCDDCRAALAEQRAWLEHKDHFLSELGSPDAGQLARMKQRILAATILSESSGTAGATNIPVMPSAAPVQSTAGTDVGIAANGRTSIRPTALEPARPAVRSAPSEHVPIWKTRGFWLRGAAVAAMIIAMAIALPKLFGPDGFGLAVSKAGVPEASLKPWKGTEAINEAAMTTRARATFTVAITTTDHAPQAVATAVVPTKQAGATAESDALPGEGMVAGSVQAMDHAFDEQSGIWVLYSGTLQDIPQISELLFTGTNLTRDGTNPDSKPAVSVTTDNAQDVTSMTSGKPFDDEQYSALPPNLTDAGKALLLELGQSDRLYLMRRSEPQGLLAVAHYPDDDAADRIGRLNVGLLPAAPKSAVQWMSTETLKARLNTLQGKLPAAAMNSEPDPTGGYWLIILITV